MENNEFCPFIGRETDSNTSHLYPSRANYCHRVNPPGRVSLTHQSQRCQTSEYKECSIYSQDRLTELPADIGVSKHKRSRRRPWRIAAVGSLLFGMGVLFFLGVGGYYQASEAVGNETSTSRAYFATPTSSPLPSPIPSSTLIPVFTSASTPLSILTPTITSTPYPTSGPNLTTPFGPNQSYLIHSVGNGESFASLKNRYQTTREVIEAINALPESDILPIGRKLVIMPGQVDPANLPIFEVVFLDQQMDVIEIAGMYSSSIEDIRYFNALDPSAESIPAGRWLIVPVEQE